MSEIPEELRYSERHEWVKLEGDRARIGLTDYAQNELTDIVYVELPKLGAEVSKGGELGVVESVKSVSDIYSPVSGKVVGVNSELENSPELINNEPYSNGWIAVIEMKDKTELDELMDADGYRELIGE